MYEINNIYCCPDNIIIDNGEVKKYDKSRYLVIDYFIIDFKEKKIETYDLKDSLPETIGTIKKIEVINQDDLKEIRIISEEYGEVIIKIDKFNRIISYTNNEVKEAENNLLLNAYLLEVFNAPNLSNIPEHLLAKADTLKVFNVSSKASKR